MVYIIKGDMIDNKEMIYVAEEGREGLWEYIRADD